MSEALPTMQTSSGLFVCVLGVLFLLGLGAWSLNRSFPASALICEGTRRPHISAGTRCLMHIPSYNPQLNWTTAYIQAAFGIGWPFKEDVAEVFEGERHSLQVVSRNSQTPWTCMNSSQPTVFAWFRSVDQNIVFAAPAIPISVMDASLNKLSVNYRIMDPGLYEVFVISVSTQMVSQGNHGNTLSVQRILDRPLALEVRQQQVDRRDGLQQRRNASLIRTPTKVCKLDDDLDGRWVRCSHEFCPTFCLRDGWKFVPHSCRFRLYHPSEALEVAHDVVGDSKPLWIVFFGSSVIRGTMHTLVDMLLPGFDLFSTSQSAPGAGSPTKCWGWTDIQVGSIRVSYQDWRVLHYLDNENDLKQASLRLSQVIDEGPDLVVAEILGPAAITSTEDVVRYLLASLQHAFVKSLLSYHGKIVLTPMKRHPAHFNCFACGFPSAQLTLTQQIKIALSSMAASIGNVSISDAIASKVVVWDENPMAAAFFFDMEWPMSEGHTWHWHRYSNEGANPRRLFGAVPEMSAHIVLAEVLQSRVDRNRHESQGNRVRHSGIERNEVKICLECPLQACCPWAAPQVFPRHTLTQGFRRNASIVPALSKLEMSSCFLGETDPGR